MELAAFLQSKKGNQLLEPANRDQGYKAGYMVFSQS